MLYRVGASVLATMVILPGVAEARMPGIISKGANTVPACVTPGRLQALLKSRNKKLDQRFERIGVDYMRHGEALNLRWDFAFFQMLVETGNLSFTGDVDAAQNNFAGIGATGGGAKGEKFSSISDGVKAHLQHLQMYAGVRVADPVAERTRKVQEWGVLDSWRSRLRRDVTFTDMTSQWAPGSRGYPRDIASVAERFMQDICNRPDPATELVAQARGESERHGRQAAATEDDKPSGEELARRATERARAEGDNRRRALGAGASAMTNLRILNGQQQDDAKEAGASPTKTAPTRLQQAALTPPPASAAGATLAPHSKPAAEAPTATAANGCKVWTASYGGQKSVIIRSIIANLANYTVLDVNDGRETREVEAFIQAYAKGGQKIGDFQNSTAALEKAFELCPEK